MPAFEANASTSLPASSPTSPAPAPTTWARRRGGPSASDASLRRWRALRLQGSLAEVGRGVALCEQLAHRAGAQHTESIARRAHTLELHERLLAGLEVHREADADEHVATTDRPQEHRREPAVILSMFAILEKA